MEYLPGNDEFQEDVDWGINRLVGNGIKSLPEDFLEYHRATMSPYWGMRGEIVETEEFATAEECVSTSSPASLASPRRRGWWCAAGRM